MLKHTIFLNERHPSENSVFHLRLLEVEKVVSTFGFEYGEKLIASFSKALKKILRESDAVGRWAGSDFVIILPRTGINIAEKVAKKLYMSLINTEIMKNIKPSLAIGITNILYDDTVENVLEKARNEMQKASKERYDRVSKA
ncbi:MAG: diguanylate cyclase [Fluviicola sp.]|nr:diguanylate cyclase [Fluviicola sp.]